MERNKRFLYENGDLGILKSQCKDCCYNENKPLSCKKYTKIPNGTRSSKIICPCKKERVE